MAIIPARGGSKGIPRKNVLQICGKPLLAHVIEAARASELVDRVVVSTDDAEIAAVAARFQADVVWRPAELATDRASSEAALLHVLDELEQREGYAPDVLAFLQCTSPLTTAEDIDGTIRCVTVDGADSATAVTRFHHFLWRRADSGAFGVNHDASTRVMRQDREPEFLEAGAVYAMRADGFRRAGHRFFGKTALYEMPQERVYELDEPADVSVAEALMRRQQQASATALLPSKVDALIMDFDGVLTDDRVWINQDGVEAVAASRGDGMGIEMLRKAGVPMFVLSKEVNPVVQARCEKLKIPCQGSVEGKREVLERICTEESYDLACVVYMGNDVNDLEAMRVVGCSVAPADAHHEVRREATMVLERPGGRGAVRELAEMLLRARGNDDGQ